jgi:hypothetical protein
LCCECKTDPATGWGMARSPSPLLHEGRSPTTGLTRARFLSPGALPFPGQIVRSCYGLHPGSNETATDRGQTHSGDNTRAGALPRSRIGRGLSMTRSCGGEGRPANLAVDRITSLDGRSPPGVSSILARRPDVFRAPPGSPTPSVSAWCSPPLPRSKPPAPAHHYRVGDVSTARFGSDTRTRRAADSQDRRRGGAGSRDPHCPGAE